MPGENRTDHSKCAAEVGIDHLVENGVFRGLHGLASREPTDQMDQCFHGGRGLDSGIAAFVGVHVRLYRMKSC